MIRARALTAGAADGTADANFWQASAEQAVRCLLHAAALGERTTPRPVPVVPVRVEGPATRSTS